MSWLAKLQAQATQALDTVKSDLKEFGQSLREDTEGVVETVKREAPHLPDKVVNEHVPGLQKKSAEVAEDVQRSLQSAGAQWAQFGRSVVTGITEISAQVSEAVQMEMEDKKQRKTRERKPRVARDPTASIGANGKYSRYDSQVAAMQRDSGTYCDEPADAAAFAEWLAGFRLEEHADAVAAVLQDNAFMQELQSRIVPLIVDRETFWTRYFFRLSKLQKEHDQREQLVKRAATEEEELSWDVDDADDADAAAAAVASVSLGEAEAEARAADAAEAQGSQSTTAPATSSQSAAAVTAPARPAAAAPVASASAPTPLPVEEDDDDIDEDWGEDP